MLRSLRHLGFVITQEVTWKQGARHGNPGPGVCAMCGVARARTYMRSEGPRMERPYCADCILRDIAAAVVPEGDVQRHPDTMPVEIPYERYRAQGGSDDFELRSIVPGSHPDPRMFDRNVA